MSTVIFYSGRTIATPGSYSEIDASGLETVGLGATGIVAVLGEAQGGRPYTAVTEADDFIRLNKPEQGRRNFRSGNLREVVDLLFGPSKDPDIPGGAVQVVPMKVNPATQSTVTLPNAHGDVVTLTSEDWGVQTTQINVSVATASALLTGKLYTIIFEDETETIDGLGGDDLFSLTYADPGTGWTTMTAQMLATGILQCLGTAANAGLTPDITDSVAPATVTVASAGADTDDITIYGLDAGGAAVSETLTLAGAVPVIGTQVFATGQVWGAWVDGTAVGVVTVSQTGGGAIMTLPLGANASRGVVLCSEFYAASTLSVVASGACVEIGIKVGINSAGAQVLEKFTLAGVVPVAGTAVFSELQVLVLGDVAGAITVTVSGTALQTVPTVQTTLQKIEDFCNSRSIAVGSGFALTMITGTTSLAPANLDVQVAAANCLSPASQGFAADQYAFVNWVNTTSELCTAVRASGAVGGAPTNTAAPVFLAGGIEGATANSDWQAALNKLKQIRVNSVVLLTPTAAIHAMGEAHCVFAGGIGRSERDLFVGVTGAAAVLPSKTELKTAAAALNSRHVRVFGQTFERYDTAGEKVTYSPYFLAAIAAGMQAGSAIGESLTWKYMNVLSLQQDSTWNPTDDSEEMIQAGICFGETIDGTGHRWVRNVTSYLISNNLAFCEGSVNEAVNYSVYTFRGNMEMAVGKKGFQGTINAAKGVAVTTLDLLVAEEILVTHRSLAIELSADVMEIECELAPIIPINFVKNAIHLVVIGQTAA